MKYPHAWSYHWSLAGLRERTAEVRALPVLVLRSIPLKFAITAVLLLTVADIALTYIGIKKGYLAELNPLMRYVLESNFVIYLLPLYLALWFALLYYYADTVKWSRSVIMALLVIKVVVMLQHLAVLIAAIN